MLKYISFLVLNTLYFLQQCFWIFMAIFSAVPLLTPCFTVCILESHKEHRHAFDNMPTSKRNSHKAQLLDQNFDVLIGEHGGGFLASM